MLAYFSCDWRSSASDCSRSEISRTIPVKMCLFPWTCSPKETSTGNSLPEQVQTPLVCSGGPGKMLNHARFEVCPDRDPMRLMKVSGHKHIVTCWCASSPEDGIAEDPFCSFVNKENGASFVDCYDGIRGSLRLRHGRSWAGRGNPFWQSLN